MLFSMHIMDKQILSEVVEMLKDLDWFFMSGMAMEVYTNGQRKAGDLDIVVKDGDAQIFAQKLGCEVKHRLIQKKNFVVDDYGFVTHYKGQEIEVTTGYPKQKVLGSSFNKIFSQRIKKTYLDVDVFVEPIESLIAHKRKLSRPKDLNDLKLLKELLHDPEKIKEYTKFYETYKTTI